MHREKGFTLLELTVAMAVFLVALGGTLRVVDSSAKAGGASVARTDAIDAAEIVANRLVLELRQSSSDLTTPGVRRYWLLGNGVRFQRVIGVETSGPAPGQQIWSPEIEYTYDATTRTVMRGEGSGTPVEVARGVTAFDVRATAGGELVVSISATRRATDGAQIAISRTRRVMPRNRAA